MGRRKKSSNIVDEESAEDKLGQELISEIAGRPWKKAELPSEDELKQEDHASPKARNNVNSRKNLIQYRNNVDQDVKEKVVKGLKYKKQREEINPFDYIKLRDDSKKDLLKAFLPDRQVLRNGEEEKYFYTMLNAFLNDFEFSELSSSDLEDIVSLAINRVIEGRLMLASKKDDDVILGVSTTIERFRKHSDKIKSNLASRRSDRIDPKSKQNFSIVDLVYAYDDKKKEEFEQRMKKSQEEMDSFVGVFDKK